MNILHDALIIDVLRTSNRVCGGSNLQRIAVPNLEYPYSEEEETAWKKDLFETILKTFCCSHYYDDIKIVGHEIIDGKDCEIIFYDGSIFDLQYQPVEEEEEEDDYSDMMTCDFSGICGGPSCPNYYTKCHA